MEISQAHALDHPRRSRQPVPKGDIGAAFIAGAPEIFRAIERRRPPGHFATC